MPARVACYAVAGMGGAADVAAEGGGVSGAVGASWAQTAKNAKNAKNALWADGLVPVGSALGEHSNASRALVFEPDKRWVAQGIHHMALLKSPEVSAQLVRWLAGSRA